MNENRLLFGKCSDEDVLERAKGSHGRWFGMIEATARQYASWGPTPKIGNRRVLGRDTLWHRHLGEGTAIFALGFRATESEWYLEQALRFLDKIASLTDWGGDLEQGHLLTGLALFTDWVWEDIDETARIRACELLGRLADSVMRQHRTGEGLGWWRRLYTQNHLWVNLAGLFLSLCALRRRAPDQLEDMQGAIDEIHAAFNMVHSRIPQDGSFHEMGGYYHYGLRPMVIYATCADWEDGIDVWNSGYLKNAASFMCHTSSADFRTYMAFGDSEPLVWGQSSLARLAAQYQDPQAQWLCESRFVDDPTKYCRGEESGQAEYFIADRVLETSLGLLWHDTAIEAKPPALTHAYFRDLGLVSARREWSPETSLFLAKCSPWGGHLLAKQGIRHPAETSIQHDHPDQMSFFYSCKGVEIISDADYEMRCSTKSHNTVLIEEAGQHGDGLMWPLVFDKWPSVVDVRNSDGLTYACCDGTDAYPKESMLKSVTRHFVFLDDVLVIGDELVSEYTSWFRVALNTYGDVTRTSTGATIVRSGVAVALEVQLPEQHAIWTEKRNVVLRQGYGHEREYEDRGTRIMIEVAPDRVRDTRFLVVLKPIESDVLVSWEDDTISLTNGSKRRDVCLSSNHV